MNAIDTLLNFLNQQSMPLPEGCDPTAYANLFNMVDTLTTYPLGNNNTAQGLSSMGPTLTNVTLFMQSNAWSSICEPNPNASMLKFLPGIASQIMTEANRVISGPDDPYTYLPFDTTTDTSVGQYFFGKVGDCLAWMNEGWENRDEDHFLPAYSEFKDYYERMNPILRYLNPNTARASMDLDQVMNYKYDDPNIGKYTIAELSGSTFYSRTVPNRPFSPGQMMTFNGTQILHIATDFYKYPNPWYTNNDWADYGSPAGLNTPVAPLPPPPSSSPS